MRQVLRSVRPEKVVTDASTKLQHDTARGGDMKINGLFLATCDRYVNYIKSCLLQSEWEAFGILDFLFHVPETPRRFIGPFRSSYFHNYHILTCPPCQQCQNNVHVHNVEHDQFILYVHDVRHLFTHFTLSTMSIIFCVTKKQTKSITHLLKLENVK